MDAAGIDESKLSAVVPATHMETELIPAIKNELMIKRSIPFVIGGNDGCLANLGNGALNTNEAALTIGTSGAVRVVIPKPATEDLNGLFRYLLTDDLYVTGAAINNGGIALQWFAENFLQTKISANEDLRSVLNLAESAPAGAENLFFLPYLLGERATIWDEEASALFYGLHINHKKEHLTRAVIEGISFSLLQILKAIEEQNIIVDKIYVSGVVTQSEWWMQLLADMFGKTTVLCEGSDASAMGAAFMGMYATGMIKDLSQVRSFVKTSKVFKTNEAVHQLYQQQYNVFGLLYPAFSKI
jgi:gluconokinase